MSSNEQTSGRGGRGRGRGRSQRAGPRHSRNSGRPLQRAERREILDIWYQLSRNARIELIESLQSMLPQNSEVALPGTPPVARRAEPGNSTGDRRRTKIWERDILKDIPEIQNWGRLPSKDRATDVATATLASVITGVIARGRRLGIPDEEILDTVRNNISSDVELKGLYQPAPVVDEADADPSNDEPGPGSDDPVQGGGVDEDMDTPGDGEPSAEGEIAGKPVHSRQPVGTLTLVPAFSQNPGGENTSTRRNTTTTVVSTPPRPSRARASLTDERGNPVRWGDVQSPGGTPKSSNSKKQPSGSRSNKRERSSPRESSPRKRKSKGGSHDPKGTGKSDRSDLKPAPPSG